MKQQKILSISFLTMLSGLSIMYPVSALPYQNRINLEFSFNSSLTVTLSGDLLIDNLSPGNSSDSNIITVTASSNSVAGYDIKATVGSSSNNYTDLRLSSSDTTNVFSALNSNVATLSSFNDSTWGYSYCNSTNDCTSNTYWVSGNAGSTNAGYNGLPIYSGTGILLADNNAPTSSTIKFKIGARASSTQASGDYTNVVNFTATAKVVTTNYTINYLANDGNNGADTTGMPNPATASSTITQSTYYTLSSATPTRDGYTFLGWCDGTVTTTSGVDSCNGTTYQPQTDYTISNAGGNVTINLNAMWKEDSETWLFKEDPWCTEIDTDNNYAINFTSNQESFSTFRCRIGLQYELWYNNTRVFYSTLENPTSMPSPSNPIITLWENQTYRIIKITGGNDVDNTVFRSWLSQNAIEVNGTLISFSINGTTYFAEDWMTWGTWVNSDYNMDNLGYIYNDGTIHKENGNMYYIAFGASGKPIHTTDLINANYPYIWDNEPY